MSLNFVNLVWIVGKVIDGNINQNYMFNFCVIMDIFYYYINNEFVWWKVWLE